MADQWHAIHDGRRMGPVSLARLKQLLQQGKLLKTDLARENNTGPWITVDTAVAGTDAVAVQHTPRRRAAPKGLSSRAIVSVGCGVGAAAMLVAVGFLSRGESPPQTGAAVSAAVAAKTPPDAPPPTIRPTVTIAVEPSAPTPEQSPTEIPSAPPAPVASDQPAPPPGDNRLADLVEQRMPSCVNILVYGTDGGKSSGSGFVVDRQGIVATNLHVVDGAAKVVCAFPDGAEVRSTGFFLVDRQRDLALIFVDPKDHALAPLPLAAALPRQGENIFVIGSPAGLSFRVSYGVVSAFARTAEIARDLGSPLEGGGRRDGFGPDVVWLQSDAAVSHGNSGGPWFNMKGEVVGVCTWGLTSGNDLSFGSAVGELTALLERLPGEPLKPWNELPQGDGAEADLPSEPADAVTIPEAVTLPSGRVIPIANALGPHDVVTMQRLRKRAWARGDEVLDLRGPSDSDLGLASFRDFKLDGTSILAGAPQRLRLIANYQDGARHGYQILFDDAGLPVLFAQYVGNRRDGVHCYLRGQQAYVVQEINRNQVAATHLFVADEVFEDVSLSDESLTEAQTAAEYVKHTDEALRKADAALRQAFEKQSEPERRLRQQRRRAAGY